MEKTKYVIFGGAIFEVIGRCDDLIDIKRRYINKKDVYGSGYTRFLKERTIETSYVKTWLGLWAKEVTVPIEAIYPLTEKIKSGRYRYSWFNRDINELEKSLISEGNISFKELINLLDRGYDEETIHQKIVNPQAFDQPERCKRIEKEKLEEIKRLQDQIYDLKR